MEAIDFHHLYAKYSRKLYQIAFSVIRDRFLAEDVVQETFLKAFRKMDQMEDSKKMASWLSQIAKRTAIDFLRAKKRKYAEPQEDSVMDALFFQQEAWGYNIEADVEMRFFMEQLDHSIKKLSKDYKDVLVLSVHFGLREKEIAARLRLKGTIVKNRLHRARKLLRKLLSEQYEQLSA